MLLMLHQNLWESRPCDKKMGDNEAKSIELFPTLLLVGCQFSYAAVCFMPEIAS